MRISMSVCSKRASIYFARCLLIASRPLVAPAVSTEPVDQLSGRPHLAGQLAARASATMSAWSKASSGRSSAANQHASCASSAPVTVAWPGTRAR